MRCGMAEADVLKVENPVPGVLIHSGWYPKEGTQGLLDEVIVAADVEYSVCPWTRSTLGDDFRVADYRSTVESAVGNVFGINDETFFPLQKKLSAFIRDLDPLVHDFRSVYDLHVTEDAGFQVLRYENKAEYRIHHDHGAHNERSLSMVCFLNDNFVGGELEFPYFDLKITPVQGMVVLFPSNFPYAHIAHPVEDGSKYSLVTWYS